MVEDTMKRKQALGFVIILIFGVSQLFAGGYYLKGQAGYAFGLSQVHIATESTFNSQLTPISVRDVYHSFGQGLQGKAAIGIPITPNLAMQFESGFSTLGGFSFEQKYADGNKQKVKASVWHIPILAGVVVSSDFNNIKPYAGAGAGVYMYSIKYTMTSSANQSEAVYKVHVKLPIGFHGMFGVEFPAGDKMSFFGEVRFVSLGLLETKEELIKAIDENGNDVLNQLPQNQKVTEYKKDSPYDPAPQLFSANGLGFFLGLKFKLQ
jgi:opacity protein-like surface antigen